MSDIFATSWMVAHASSVHGILQARMLEWVAIPFSSGYSQPKNQTHVSCTGSWILKHSIIKHNIIILLY